MCAEPSRITTQTLLPTYLHLADLGFKQISVEPVVAPPTEDYAIREEDLPVIFEQYDILARRDDQERKRRKRL